MNPKYESLFQPIRIGNLELKNRFMMCPMEGTAIIGWLMGKGFEAEKEDFYLERAKDGIALMVPGTCPLKSMMGNEWLWKHPEVFELIKPFMDKLHAYDSHLFLQLTAGWGRAFTLGGPMRKAMDDPVFAAQMKAAAGLEMNDIMVAPDEGAPNVWAPEYKCRQITEEEIEAYIEAYAQTALLAKNAGIDGVEVHAVHEGYLMDQFAMPYTNHRTDKWGGSFENRYRFAVEVVKRIKAYCGEDYPVSLRYSVVSKTKGFNDGAVPGEDFIEAGRDMAESERAIKYLEEAGYDMFSCDNGTYDAWYWAHPPVYMPLNCNLEDVAHIKQFTDKPVYCAGRMQIDTAAEAIAAGQIDGLGIGRQFLTDNAVISKVCEDRTEDIKPCISCHMGCLPMAHFKGIGIEFPEGATAETGHCALCPRSLKESAYPLDQAENPKHIAVIGGGIGGMEVAIQAAMRGHHVDLYEKTDRLGGVFIAAAAPSFKEKDKDLIEWYRREIAKSSVSVHFNTEVKSLRSLDADEIVIATGAKPRALPIPGWEKTINAEDFLFGKRQVGDRVAIIGGGITGCEVAYELALQGKHPFIIEVQDDLIKTDLVPAANSILLRDLLKFHKVPAYLESKTLEITDDAVRLVNASGEQTIPCDSVIVSVGYSSDRALVPETLPANIHVIGDANKVANLKSAIWAANDLVMSF